MASRNPFKPAEPKVRVVYATPTAADLRFDASEDSVQKHFTAATLTFSHAPTVGEIRASLEQATEAKEFRFLNGQDFLEFPTGNEELVPEGTTIYVKVVPPRVTTTRSHSTTADIMRVCEDQWQLIRPAKIALVQEDHRQLMKEYRGSHRPVFTIRGAPSLLWDGLEDEATSPAKKLLEDIKSDLPHVGATMVHILVGCSGAGKTRTLYQVGSKEFAMFFTGRVDKVGGAAGSLDIKAMSTHIEAEFASVDVLPLAALEVCVGITLLARLFVLWQCKLMLPRLTPLQWLFMQQEFSLLHLQDIFYLISASLMQRLCTKDGDLLRSLAVILASLNDLTDKLQSLPLIYVLDEAQTVNEFLPNRFPSGLGGRKSSMLAPMVQALQHHYNIPLLLLSGTGTSLLSIVPVLKSKTLKQIGVKLFSDFGGFDDRASMDAYVNKYFDMEEEVKQFVFSLYRGRYRSLAMALEAYMVDEKEPLLFFQDLANQLTCSRGGESGGTRGNELKHLTYFDEVEKFFVKQRHGYDKLEEWCLCISVAFYYGGYGARFKDQASLALVEGSIGRVASVSTALEVEGLCRYNGTSPFKVETEMSNEDFWKIEVIMDEPLLMRALREYLIPSGILRMHEISRFAQRRDAGVIGLEFEELAAEALGDFFDGKAPIEVCNRLSKGGEVFALYRECAHVVKPMGGLPTPILVSIQDDCRLSAWLDGAGKTSPPYFHTGPDGTAGPDVIFLLGVKNRWIPVFVQMRTGTPKKDAFDALDPQDLFKHNKEGKVRNVGDLKGVQILQTLCAENGFVQVVVANPLENLTPLLHQKTTAVRDTLPRPCKTTKRESHKVAPLMGVVDGHNFLAVYGQEFTDLMHVMKANRRKTTLSTQ